MISVDTLAKRTEDQVVHGLELAQSTLLQGARVANSVATKAVPARMRSRAAAGTAVLALPAAAAARGFDFAERLLANQRAFVTDLGLVSAPAETTSAPKPAAKRAARSKS
jgi:hypothetical protein